MSKVIRIRFGFALLRVVMHHFLSQSELKQKLIVTHSRSFSRAFLLAPTICTVSSSFDWFTELSLSFVTGQNDCFGVGFMTLNSKTALK